MCQRPEPARHLAREMQARRYTSSMLADVSGFYETGIKYRMHFAREWQQVRWLVEAMEQNPIESKKPAGTGVVFELSDEDKARLRELHPEKSWSELAVQLINDRLS